MFLSDLRGQEIIKERTKEPIPKALQKGKVGSGYIERDYSAIPEGSIEFATRMPIKPIPRSQWGAIIERNEKLGANISSIRRLHQLKSSNQGSLGYCWIHGCCNGMRLLRAQNQQTYADLEPTSAGAIIKNYRNQGGNTPEAIRHLATVGVATSEFWTPNKLNRAFDTPKMRENAARHRLTEWWELKSNSFDELATCLLLGYPVTLGLSWWSHMIVAMDLVKLGADEFGVRIWNSWGDGWGDNGEKILVQQKAIAFDQMCPRVVTLADLGPQATSASPYGIAV